MKGEPEPRDAISSTRYALITSDHLCLIIGGCRGAYEIFHTKSVKHFTAETNILWYG